MEAISIISFVWGALAIGEQTVKLIKRLQDGISGIQRELETLSGDIGALLHLNEAIANLAQSLGQDLLQGVSASHQSQARGLWDQAESALKGCKAAIEELNTYLEEIIGIDEEDSSPSRWEAFKKYRRKESRKEDLSRLQDRIKHFRERLQVLLTALDLVYTRYSEHSTKLSVEQVSTKIDDLEQNLLRQIASLHREPHFPDKYYFDQLTTPAATLASTVSLNRHYDVPGNVSGSFTGRESRLVQLQQAFDLTDSESLMQQQKRFVVYGLPGSGKTWFCYKFADVTRRLFWGVFTIDASTRETANTSFSKISKVGGVEANERAAKSWLAGLDKPWLLIIDGADDSEVSTLDYFPSGERGCILVTTRNPANRIHGTVKVGDRCYYHFEKLEEEEAKTLLLKAADKPEPWDAATKDSASRVARELGYLPLALVHAGKAVLNGVCSLDGYLGYYRQSWERIEIARAQSQPSFEQDDHAMMVCSSFEVLYHNLDRKSSRKSQDAIQLLNTFAFFHHADIGVDWLIKAGQNPNIEDYLQNTAQHSNADMKQPRVLMTAAKDVFLAILDNLQRLMTTTPWVPEVLQTAQPSTGFDRYRLKEALSELSRSSLIIDYDGERPFSMHPLVHEWVRHRQRRRQDQPVWCEAAAATLARCIIFSLSDAEIVKKNQPDALDLLPHITTVLGQRETLNDWFEGNRRRAFFPKPFAGPYFGRHEALRYVKFSLWYSKTGHFDEAARLQETVLRFVCKYRGKRHPYAILLTQALAATRMEQSRINEAADLQQQALESCRHTFGIKNLQTLKAMDRLGTLRCFQGLLEDSRRLHEEAIAGLMELKGPESMDTLIALNNFGLVMWRLFRFDDAVSIHKDAIAGFAKLFPGSPEHLDAKENLAMDYAIQYIQTGHGSMHEAHELILEVLKERRKKLGKENPYTLLSIMNLGRVLTAMDKAAEAEDVMRPALAIAERNLGKDHFGPLAGKTHLAHALTQQGKFQEAERLFSEVIEVQKYSSAARKDGEHPDRILALWYLLQCYEKQGKYDAALEKLDEMRDAFERIGGQGRGKQHPMFFKAQDRRAYLAHEAIQQSARERNGSGSVTPLQERHDNSSISSNRPDSGENRPLSTDSGRRAATWS